MKAIKLFSDNFDGTLMTKECYEHATAQMSTGDFHMHKKEIVEVKKGTKVMDVSEYYGGELPDNMQDCYADHVYVLKTYRWAPWLVMVLYQTVELGYFKNGRANMHTVRRYHVEIWVGRNGNSREDRSWFTRKADATKYFNSLKAKYVKE